MSLENIGSVLVYQKAESLYEISSHLASYISLNKGQKSLQLSTSLRDSLANAILTDARLISYNMAEALSSKSYSERLKNTTFINIMIRNINSYCMGLEKDGVYEKEYLNLLRTEVTGFRKSFKNWMHTLPNSPEGL